MIVSSFILYFIYFFFFLLYRDSWEAIFLKSAESFLPVSFSLLIQLKS